MFTVWLCTLLWFSLAESQCDDGWRSHDGSCWFISNTAALTDHSWQQGREYCLQQGGELASVLSQQDQDFIVSWAEDEGYNEDLWIGLNQLQDRTSDHTWSDGSSLAFEAWAPGQPNRYGEEKCVYMNLRPAGGCYERLTTISTVDGIIDNPMSPPEGCSRHYQGASTWQWCEEKCDEDATCDVYTHFSNSHPDTVWMGECLLCTKKVVGDNRVVNEYATSGIKERCENATAPDNWYSTNCGYEKGFVCKKTPGSDQPVTVPPTPQVPGYCPTGFFGVANKCFKMYSIPYPDGIGWDEARENCLQEPGIEPDIASLTTLEEQSVVTAALTNHSWGLWIGYREYQGKWLWADNSDPTSFTNWATTDQGYGDCAEVRTHPGPAGIWGKLYSGDKRGYICQTYKDESNVISTSIGNSNNCPSGFVSYWYGCYKLETVSKSFEAAESACSNLNSTLVSIHDEAENAAVFALSEGNLPLWIGLKKENEEYEWLDGWPEIYTKWGADEPGNGEGCVAMDTDSTWNDTTCSSQYAYMCKYTEVKAPTTPAFVEGICPSEEWEEWGEHCFLIPDLDDYYVETKPWNEALEHCRAIGAGYNGDLASVHSRVTNDWIHDKLGDTSYYQDGVWIGLKRDDPASSWQWTDGTAVNYMNWAPGAPNGQGSEDSCVEMHSRLWPGLWNDHTCTDWKPFVCMAEKVPAPTPPPQGPGDCPNSEWVHYGEYCFLFRPDEYEDWIGANYGCLQEHEDAHLASVRSGEENWFIQQKLKEISNLPEDKSSWTGLIQTNENDNENYHWHDGTPLEYTNWAAGEPSNPNERCVGMHSSSGQWSDTICDNVFGYACSFKKAVQTTTDYTTEADEITTEIDDATTETQPTEPTTTTASPQTSPPATTPPQGPGECPGSEWVHYGDACFLFKPDHHISWSAAHYACLDAGGHDLASILSADEELFVLQNSLGSTHPEFYHGVWIGLYQSLANSNDYYHWVDGSVLTYTNWADGQPSDPAHRCVVQTVSGDWEDQDCGQLKGYVCKYEKDVDLCIQQKKAAAQTYSGSSGMSRDFLMGVVSGAVLGVAIMLLLYAGVSYRKRRTAGNSTNEGNPAVVVSYDNKTFNETI